jgi:hypothetical protein
MLIRLLGIIFGAMFLTACNTEPMMHEVMQTCNSNSKFSEYVNCLKINYKRNPDLQSVQSFYAQLDATLEDYNRGKLTEAKAKAKAYELYDATIGVGNRAAAQRAASGSTVIVNNSSPIYTPTYTRSTYQRSPYLSNW